MIVIVSPNNSFQLKMLDMLEHILYFNSTSEARKSRIRLAACLISYQLDVYLIDEVYL
jgi:hypothetical protein